jgi:hypothetical protein
VWRLNEQSTNDERKDLGEQMKCDNCGEIECVLVDGYAVGDRMLEGVMFIVEDDNGKPKVIGVTDECKAYFEDFNQKKFIKAMQEYCKDLDVATCQKCGGEVEVWGANKSQAPIKIKKYKATDIFH